MPTTLGEFDPLGLGSKGANLNPGAWYPPEGLLAPPVDPSLPGIVQAFGGDRGVVWIVQVGSKAWEAWWERDDGTSLGWKGGKVGHLGPVAPNVEIKVTPPSVIVTPPRPAPTGKGDSTVPLEVVNDPTLGPVVAGQPTDGGLLGQLWRTPGRLVGMFLPKGPVQPLVGMLLLLVPFGLLALLVLWFLKRRRE